MISNNLKVIDLFCGAGGLSQGFCRAGFSVLAANDSDEFAGATFSASHPEARFLHGPIEQVGSQKLFEATDIRQGELDCLIGGPPCQGFSTAGERDGSDPRM
jgi:DNA (cytosine-5)-methyltransferase 1